MFTATVTLEVALRGGCGVGKSRSGSGDDGGTDRGEGSIGGDAREAVVNVVVVGYSGDGGCTERWTWG